MRLVFSVLALLLVAFVACEVDNVFTPRMNQVMPIKMLQREMCALNGQCPKPGLVKLSDNTCVNGQAAGYPCNNVDLLSFVPLSDLGSSGDGNDIWGWTDPESGKEYAIMCCVDGTSFIDVSTPTNPVVLGWLPSNSNVPSIWRDAKVLGHYVYIGSENYGHGMQVFDLNRLRDLTGGRGKPTQLTEDALYTGFGSSHNIVVTEGMPLEKSYIYAVGSNTCNYGLHVVDVSDPLNPQAVNPIHCFGEDYYVHDAQCINYQGPDTDYVGKEICFNYDEDTLTIVDVDDKANMKMISRTPYERNRYTHQGWLSDDHSHLLMNDELDEMYGTTASQKKTRSLIWDITDLENPVWTGSFHSSENAIDHNLYIKGNYAYESNYSAGLRILDVSNIANAELTEAAFFDVCPDNDSVEFVGTWSNYPFFESGIVIVSSIERGLFVLQPNLN